MKKYYLNLTADNKFDAGSKAVKDCYQILKENGFKNYDINNKKEGNKVIKKLYNICALRKFYGFPNDSLIVFPHPIYTETQYINILKKIKKKKNLTYVFLIHDLETLRGLFLDDKEKFELWDKTMLEIADYIISHNDKMTEYLVDYGIPRDRIFDLEVFDYLYPNENTITYDKSVLLAGNLNPQKSNYISQLKNIKNVNFELYGVNCSDECLADNVNYNGAFPPDDVPAQLTKGFGLVWDGSSVDECTGNTGNYLRYNNPHKLSLYLASGIPVIVWKQSAEAGFVEKYNVGFAVESLNELTDIISDMTEEKYFDIVKNVKDVSNKVRNGYFLSKSLETIKKL